MRNELNKGGKSGEIIGLTSEQREPIGHLSREQMMKVIESLYASADAIATQFTYQVGTNDIIGDKNRITSEMLGDLQRSINLMWHEISGAEIEQIKRHRDEQQGT